jgi:hypothetical protein
VLKTGTDLSVAAVLFGWSAPKASRVFCRSALALDWWFSKQFVCPSRVQCQLHLPESYRRALGVEHAEKMHHTFDAHEIFCETPACPVAARTLWSEYKNHHTMKLLAATGPNGEFTFVSCGYGGRATDNDLTRCSGFLKLIEKGTVCLTDRGFTVKHEFNERGATLLHPPFSVRGVKHFTEQDAEHTSGIARVRIHIERAFARVGLFHWLEKEIKLSQQDIAGVAFRVACMLTNLFPSLLKSEVKEQFFGSD